MQEVFDAALIWIGTHLVLATNPLRALLVKVLGERLFLVAYSLVAFAALGYLIWIYAAVPKFDYLWTPNPDLYWVSKLTMPIAMILLLGGFMVRNPTMVGASLEEADMEDPARGVTRITRHPFQWAVVIWGLGHVVANGDWVSIIFFFSFVLVSGLGTWLMDRKKAQSLGAGWQGYAAVTSNLPFAAIAAGRNRLVWAELWLPIVVGLVGYALIYYFHEALTGAVIV